MNDIASRLDTICERLEPLAQKDGTWSDILDEAVEARRLLSTQKMTMRTQLEGGTPVSAPAVVSVDMDKLVSYYGDEVWHLFVTITDDLDIDCGSFDEPDEPTCHAVLASMLDVLRQASVHIEEL